MLLQTFNGKVSNNNSSNDAVRQLVLQTIIANAPILKYLQFYKMTGSADEIAKNSGISGGGVRTIGNPYQDAKPTPDFESVVLRIFGGKVSTDRELDARNGDLADEHLAQITRYARGVGKNFMNRFVNDVFSASTFDGIKQLAKDRKRNVVFDPTGDGIVTLDDTATGRKQIKKFVIELDNAIDDTVDPTFLLMDSKTRSYLRSYSRDAVRTTTVKDLFGVDQTLEDYNGLPIVIAGTKDEENGRVIPHNEVEGSRTACSSLYVVSTEEKSNLTAATNVGLRLYGPNQVEDVMINSQIDLSIGLALANDKALTRLCGFELK